jgi:hypothetical protein
MKLSINYDTTLLGGGEVQNETVNKLQYDTAWGRGGAK